MNFESVTAINLIAKRNLFFSLSATLILTGVIFLAIFGIPLGVDFTGGSLWELKFDKMPKKENLTEFFVNQQLEIVSLQPTENSFILRTKFLEQSNKDKIFKDLSEKFGTAEELRFETIGPTFSAELTQKAILALSLAAVAILGFVAWAFRKVPKPASSLSFGVCAILALIHDLLILVGGFAILARFGATIDSLFITAALAVLGFSVNDTIVVFDRVRENLTKFSQDFGFADIVNFSVLQTLGRSLSTSITVVIVLVALLLFGGATIKWFVAALLIGIIVGTYSSIFIAAPLLVVWQRLFKK